MYVHVAASRLEEAMDLLFDRVDDALCDGRIAEVDALLPAVNLRRLDSNLLIGLLSVTFPAKDVLPNRAPLALAVEANLMETEAHRIEGLMSGLR